MSYLNLPDAKIYYEIHGQGPPLLMISGMGSDSKSWQFILDSLCPHFTLILMDNRGVGRTTYQGPFSLLDIAADAIALVDHLGYDKVDVSGHSMGGMIVQEMALNYPDRLQRLILASSSPQLSSRAKSILDDLSEKWENGYDMAEWYRIMFTHLFTPKALANEKFMDAAIIFALAYPYPQTLERFRDQVRAITGFDARERIRDIRHRTLIMAGKEDRLITPDESKDLTKIRGANEFILIEEAAHSLHAENPMAFSNAVLRFLNKG